VYRDIAQNSAGKRNSVNAKARRNSKFIVNIFHTRRIFYERKRERDIVVSIFFLSRSMSRNVAVPRVRRYRRTRGWNLRSCTWHARTKAPMPTKCHFAFGGRPPSLWVTQYYYTPWYLVISKFGTWLLKFHSVRAVARKMHKLAQDHLGQWGYYVNQYGDFMLGAHWSRVLRATLNHDYAFCVPLTQ